MQSGAIDNLALHVSQANLLIYALDPISSPTSSISLSSELPLSAPIFPILNKHWESYLASFDTQCCIKIALKGHLYLTLSIRSLRVFYLQDFRSSSLLFHLNYLYQGDHDLVNVFSKDSFL